MSEVFLKVINMSISAGWIVLAVLVLRLLLRKAPKWMTVLLWGIVALRLACPFSIESALSLLPSAETVSPAIMLQERPEINTGIPMINSTINPVIGDTLAPTPGASANPLQIWIPVLSVIWIAGVMLLLAYMAISYIRLRKRVETAVLLRDNIFQSEAVAAPFVLGIAKPRIYLPFSVSEKAAAHVIAHERAHIRRRDHLWKPLGFLLAALHWFNPLIWLGYALLCKDIELACDERVVRDLSGEQRADYSEALLGCSTDRRSLSACPLAFGEVGVKERVKGVLSYKKPALWIIIAAVAAIIIAATCLLTSPQSGVSPLPVGVEKLDGELKAFLDAEVARHNWSESAERNCVTVSYDLMKVDKGKQKTTVYAWILYQEYSCENGVLREECGSHIPTVITAEEKDGEYRLLEYWEPRAGSLYADDIRSKFPMYLWSWAIDSQRSIKKQIAECEQMAKEHFGITGAPESENTLMIDRYYRYRWEKDIATLSLVTADKKCSFSLSMLSSYWPVGTYEETDEYIIMHTDDGMNKYTFRKEGGNLIFVAEQSSRMPSYAYSAGAEGEVCVPDGAVFLGVSLYSGSLIDSADFDIDSDGVVETCTLSSGPTSGLFTFILSAYEDGVLEYRDLFNAPWMVLSFESDAEGRTVLVGDEGDRVRYMNMTVREGSIVLTSDSEDIDTFSMDGIG